VLNTSLTGEAALTVLDCESFESSLKSICDLYEVNVAHVTEFLQAVDLDKEYEKRTASVSSSDLLSDLFQSRFGLPTRAFQQVCWFHLTRVPLGTNFSEGILPLHLALEKIWQTIVSIVPDTRTKENLRTLQTMGVPDNLYALKTQSLIHSGPHAMLVRESAFHAKSMGNHDYLAFPEIIEDICNGYEKVFGEHIHEEVSTGLKPCIVKFEVAEEDGNQLITPVLFYCWYEVHNQELSLAANTCYVSEGITIPKGAIRKIEFL